ncbi:hypothetical protein AKJ16_DCAP25324, partial [Drosera capensis]
MRQCIPTVHPRFNPPSCPPIASLSNPLSTTRPPPSPPRSTVFVIGLPQDFSIIDLQSRFEIYYLIPESVSIHTHPTSSRSEPYRPQNPSSPQPLIPIRDGTRDLIWGMIPTKIPTTCLESDEAPDRGGMIIT